MEDFYVSKPTYEHPPDWIPPEQRSSNNDYNNDINQFLPRSVKIRRMKKNDVLGFNIRGGKEHHCGLYISKVMLNTDAHRLGLREGDQVLRINDTSFENIDHAEAINILKSNKELQLTVRYFPYGYKKTYEARGPPSASYEASPIITAHGTNR
ncbi:unnamed protein product [Owenia fusiformis]|uniref:PDZ domain-containing protein n=1 Tax=Owenia fusiformis TaxID=6347 RepID=A0A8J1TGV6_OWEFU|nr:unnamed protein product [Owenia fusiformis]